MALGTLMLHSHDRHGAAHRITGIGREDIKRQADAVSLCGPCDPDALRLLFGRLLQCCAPFDNPMINSLKCIRSQES